MTGKGIIFMALIILTLFVSTVKAADKCTAGANADKKNSLFMWPIISFN